MLREYLSTLANAFRSKLGTTEKINAQDYPNKIDEVYEAGYNKGKSEGGGDSYDDVFWDNYQDNGDRTDCMGMFMGTGWNNNTLKPKHSISPKNASYMFCKCSYSGDLNELFDGENLTLDFSNCTAFNYTFWNANNITRLGTIDASKVTASDGLDSIFNCAKLKIVDSFVPPKIPVKAVCFYTASNNIMERFIVSGSITKDFNLSRCSKLDDDSVQSAIDHLVDLTGGTTQTLTFAANIGNRLTQEQKDQITAKNWTLAY